VSSELATTCEGGTRCLCEEHTSARLAKARGELTLVEALSPEARAGYVELGVDALARRSAELTGENEQLREERVVLNMAAASAERRVDQVLAHRRRSRAWSAAGGVIALGILDGTFAHLLYAAWGAL
jgi:hypothetical protein